jgi:hypothetical protein
VDLIPDLIQLFPLGQRTDGYLLVHWVTNFDILIKICLQSVNELRVNFFMDNESLRIVASLSIGSESPAQSLLCCQVEICIVQHNKRVRAAKLEATSLHCLPAGLCYLLATFCAPNKFYSP